MILKIYADASVLPAHPAIVTEIAEMTGVITAEMTDAMTAEMTDAIVIKFDLKRKDIK
ncbi:hypothetical protein MR857_04690 [bacterium]|nr:hypothetical protein [bacterium]MDY3023104.1 hypothetical protein [Oliverpabstia sp.]